MKDVRKGPGDLWHEPDDDGFEEWYEGLQSHDWDALAVKYVEGRIDQFDEWLHEYYLNKRNK